MKVFGLQEKGTNFVSEIFAGITAFITAAYLPLLCAGMISDGQERQTAALAAMCFSSFVGCLIMAIVANKPFVVGPSIGMITVFTTILMVERHYSFAQAIALMFIAGCVFLLLSVTGLQNKIMGALPQAMKNAVSAGLGIYLALLGLRNTGFMSTASNGSWTLIDFSQHGAQFFTVFVLLVGIVIICMCKQFNIPNQILVGVIASAIIYYMIGVPSGLVKLDGVSLSMAGTGGRVSSWAANMLFKNFTVGLAKLFGSVQMTAESLSTVTLLVLSCSFFSCVESTSVAYATARNSGMLDEGGNFPDMKKTVLANAIASTVGTCLGCPAMTVLPESNAGTAVKGKTGLTSLTAGVLFFGAVLFAPLFAQIPTVVTASALIYVGVLMMTPIKDVDFGDISESIPAFVTMILMPFTSSIIDSIALGLVMHTALSVFTLKLKSIKLMEVIMTAVFIFYYFFM